jgi:hypothetical protein
LKRFPRPLGSFADLRAGEESEFDAKLLMNHAIPGVNAGYITRHKLLEDYLRSQQQAISAAVFAALGETLVRRTTVRNWLVRKASRQAFQLEPNASARLMGHTATMPSEGRGQTKIGLT